MIMISPTEPKRDFGDQSNSDSEPKSDSEFVCDVIGGDSADVTEYTSDKQLCHACKVCARWSKSVEVLYRNMNGEQILTRINFPFNPDVLITPY